MRYEVLRVSMTKSCLSLCCAKCNLRMHQIKIYEPCVSLGICLPWKDTLIWLHQASLLESFWGEQMPSYLIIEYLRACSIRASYSVAASHQILVYSNSGFPTKGMLPKDKITLRWSQNTRHFLLRWRVQKVKPYFVLGIDLASLLTCSSLSPCFLVLRSHTWNRF